MKKIAVVFFLLLTGSNVFASNDVAVLIHCRPDATFAGNVAALKNYTGTLPDQAEWNACEIAVDLNMIRSLKKEEIKAEAIRRVQLIDDEFTERSIATFRRLNVAALDAEGQNIRSILIYAKQKLVWVNTASIEDMDAYDPADDLSWP